MRLTGWQHDGTWVFEFELSGADLEGVAGPAGEVDLMAECAASESVADKLLALEAIARRVEDRAVRDMPQDGEAPTMDTAEAGPVGARHAQIGTDDAGAGSVPAERPRRGRFRRGRRPPDR